MNEAAQVLKQTNHERKVAGYGAHHKKGGSAISKLGNKPMSWQEINSKHGECKEYDLGDFMDYETFKKMDPDLEVEYVNKLCEKYHVRHEQVSKYLFELGESDLMARLKIKGVDKKVTKIKASDVSDDAVKDFCDQIELWRQKTEAAKIIDLSEAQRKHDIIENAEFIEYEEFSGFTTDEKVLYLNSLIDKYGVSLTAIERELFKFTSGRLRYQLETAGVLQNVKRGRMGTAGIKANTAFCEALKEWRGDSIVEDKTETAAEPVKEEPSEVARDILAAIIGEEPEKPSNIISKILQVNKVEKPAEVAAEEPKKDDLPESNISAVYIPVTMGKFDDSVKEMPEEPLETITDAESFVEQPDIPKTAPKPSSEVYFSTRYISEKGLDRETILNKIYLLASLFENEENLEVTLTVATKKEA